MKKEEEEESLRVKALNATLWSLRLKPQIDT
jgi:hypothetical protein